MIANKEYPNYRRISQTTPIFEDENKTDATYYRPISLLCCTSKIFIDLFSTYCTSTVQTFKIRTNLGFKPNVQQLFSFNCLNTKRMKMGIFSKTYSTIPRFCKSFRQGTSSPPPEKLTTLELEKNFSNYWTINLVTENSSSKRTAFQTS